ncbi:MAG: hypothetical protein WCI88_15400, partial [Chloroflexota bacterium]
KEMKGVRNWAEPVTACCVVVPSSTIKTTPAVLSATGTIPQRGLLRRVPSGGRSMTLVSVFSESLVSLNLFFKLEILYIGENRFFLKSQMFHFSARNGFKIVQ